ncbi:MAG: hypothetical protein MI757_19680 [Pirellulales bacterium]|nr:hypothetical protein [Pirellulales bacterium]
MSVVLTLSQRLFTSANRRWQVACILVVGCAVLASTARQLPAQDAGRHFLQTRNLSPGAIGRERLKRPGPVHGYFQPVEIHAPKGALVSVAMNGAFGKGQDKPIVAGMLIAHVYRLKVTNIPIPYQEGLEVYPTIEVIDRTYPPEGQRLRFPIMVDLTLADLRLATEGALVERYIYLEDTHTAAPVADSPTEQGWFEVADEENPLEVADQLGRPVAIVRMGGRVPPLSGPTDSFLYGSPPVETYPEDMLPKAPKPLPPLPKPKPKAEAPAADGGPAADAGAVRWLPNRGWTPERRRTTRLPFPFAIPSANSRQDSRRIR